MCVCESEGGTVYIYLREEEREVGNAAAAVTAAVTLYECVTPCFYVCVSNPLLLVCVRESRCNDCVLCLCVWYMCCSPAVLV